MSVSCLFNIMCIPIEKEEAELLNPVVLHIWFPIFTYLLSLFSYLVFGILLEKGGSGFVWPSCSAYLVFPPLSFGLGYWFGHLNWPNKLITANIVPSIVMWYFAVSQCETLEAFQNSLEPIEATASALEWIVEVHCPGNNQTLTIQIVW